MPERGRLLPLRRMPISSLKSRRFGEIRLFITAGVEMHSFMAIFR